MVGHYKRSKFLVRGAGARFRPARSARGGRESLRAGGAVGHQADADRADDRGLHARANGGDARHRSQRGPRARRRAGPPAGGRARQARRALHPGSRGRQPLAGRDLRRCWPRSPAARPRAFACLCAGVVQRRGVRGPLAPHRPAARRGPDRRPHGAQAHVLQPGQGRSATWACPRPIRSSRCATPSRGSRPTTWSPPAYEPRQPERQSDPQEPIQLLLRVSLAPARPARRALRGLRVLPHGGRRRRPRPRSGRPARGARALADRCRAVLRAGPGPRAPDRAAAARRGGRLSDPPRGAGGDHRRVRDGSAARALRARRGSLSVLLPGGLGGRSLLRRDLRLHRPARPRVRRAARHRAAAHEHHPRRGHGREGRPRVPAAAAI